MELIERGRQFERIYTSTAEDNLRACSRQVYSRGFQEMEKDNAEAIPLKVLQDLMATSSPRGSAGYVDAAFLEQELKHEYSGTGRRRIEDLGEANSISSKKSPSFVSNNAKKKTVDALAIVVVWSDVIGDPCSLENP